MHNKFLYPCFDKWIGSIWFIADTHFGDAEINKIRNISSDELVKRINRKVSKNDTLVMLGDVGDLEYVKKLKAGYKVLVMGNHDKGASNYKRVVNRYICNADSEEDRDKFIKQNYTVNVSDQKIHFYNMIKIEDNHLFDEVYEGALMINEKIILTHEPVEFPFAFNIHGHDHNGSDFKKHVLSYYDTDMSIDDMSENYLNIIKKDNLKKLNVCADWVGYSPVCLKNIIDSGALKDIIDIHRITIDKATAKAKECK